MNRIIRHIILPGLASVLFFAVAATPVAVLGCRNRGLLAVTIALVSVIAALASAAKGDKGKHRGDADAEWWIVSALILALPAVALVVLA